MEVRIHHDHLIEFIGMNEQTKVWFKQRPVAPGWYWCSSNGYTRVVQVWFHQQRNQLRTNVAMNAPLDDPVFDNSYWIGPLKVPEGPSIAKD